MKLVTQRLRIVPLLLLVFGVVSVTWSGADAQARDMGWTVSSPEGAHLWYHGLATVGFEGFAALPMYDFEYVASSRVAKEAKGIYPTSLDRSAARFRQAFEADSTFEVLHFLPLYFGTASPSAMYDVITGITRRNVMPPPGAETEFAGSVIASVLRSRRQRQVLAEFADALMEEWNLFLREHRSETISSRDRAISLADRRWVLEVVPTVAGFLEQRNMTGGLVMVSSALGPEGRVFEGDRANPNDNVLAVSLAHSETGLGTSAFLLKELCFPVASSVVESLGLSMDRVNAERLSGRLAVRCGALLLDQQDVDLAREYRSTFLAVAAANGIQGTSFESVFAVDDRSLERLNRALSGQAR